MDKCRSPHILLVRVLALHIRLNCSQAAFHIFFSSGMNPQIIIWVMQSQGYFHFRNIERITKGKILQCISHYPQKLCQVITQSLQWFPLSLGVSAELILYLSCHLYCYPWSAPWFKVSVRILFNICFCYKSFYPTFYIF